MDISSKYSAEKILQMIRTKKAAFWSREREQRPLKLFHEAARRVPAYKDFLKKNHINPAKIKTFKDFQLVPPVDKKNYLRQYPIEKLVWDGTLAKSLVWTSTSGSSGQPTYFPRSDKLDWESSILHELFLENSSHGAREPTLVIVGFGMGAWIAGLITYRAFEMASQRGFNLSIITPGINKVEILHSLRRLSPHFKQTIIAGYPPFLKDIIDEAPGQGINLKKLNVRLLFAAEAFTEKFREYLVRKAGVKNPYLDTLNVYGTADIGTMAYETPFAILIRQLAVNNKKLFGEIFSNISKTPTLAQYNPFFITFEALNGEIILTGDNTVPLIRYAVGDHGGIYTFGEITQLVGESGKNLKREISKAGIEKTLYQLPFVYVYERKDFSTTLYGLQIYPEVIREVLIDKPLSKFFTGKLSMMTKFDKKHNQYLEVHLELKKNKKLKEYLKHRTLKQIILNLRFKNSEFRELHNYLQERAHPKLVFWPYEHPIHFRPGIKQKWVKKQ